MQWQSLCYYNFRWFRLICCVKSFANDNLGSCSWDTGKSCLLNFSQLCLPLFPVSSLSSSEVDGVLKSLSAMNFYCSSSSCSSRVTITILCCGTFEVASIPRYWTLERWAAVLLCRGSLSLGTIIVCCPKVRDQSCYTSLNGQCKNIWLLTWPRLLFRWQLTVVQRYSIVSWHWETNHWIVSSCKFVVI